MKRRDAEEKRIDDARLLKQWRAWHRKQREEALAGAHGAVVGQVFDFIEDMGPRSAPDLIALLRAIDWRCIDGDTRFIVLHEVNTAITALRETAGLDPIDDALPGESATGFLIIREILGWQE